LFLSEVLSEEGFDFNILDKHFSRVPLWYTFNWISFNIFSWGQNFIGMYFFFVIHAIAFSLLSYYIVKSIRLDVTMLNFILLTTLFVLYPTHYEILYWVTCMPYVLGLLVMAIALLSRRMIVKIIFLILSLMFYETYLIPSLMFLVFPIIYSENINRHIFKKILIVSVPWFFAVGLVLLFQFLNSIFFSGFYPFPFEFNFIAIVNNIYFSVISISTFHFYGFHIMPSLIFVSIFLFIILYLLITKNISLKKLEIILITCVVATTIHWVLGYKAPRALYGAQIYVNLILLLFLFLFTAKTNLYKYIFIMILFLLFINESIFIFKIKDSNYDVLYEHELVLVQEMNNCQEPCNIKLIDLDKGLRQDWVLYSDHWERFAKWVKNKYSINKEIKFDITK